MPILKLRPEWRLGNLPNTSNQELSDGTKGNLETVEIMKRVARDRSRSPLVRKLAHNILLTYQVGSQYYKDEALAIGDYVKKNVRYVRDINGVETLTDPFTLIDQLTRGEAQGDCDDISLLIATLLLSIGHQPYFRIIKYNHDPFTNWQHIYVVDYERNPGQPKQRIVLDGIIKRKPIGYEIKHLQGKEIEV
jgi:hypothetical protein